MRLMAISPLIYQLFRRKIRSKKPQALPYLKFLTILPRAGVCQVIWWSRRVRGHSQRSSTCIGDREIRASFFPKAVEMAKGRAIGIMIDAPYWRPDLPPPSKGKETEQSSAHELVQFRCCHAPIEKSELACVAHLACGIQETGHCRAIE